MFRGKVQGKLYGRGLYFATHGYSQDAPSELKTGKELNLILVDGADLCMIFGQRLSFNEMLDRKIKAAQTRGWIYVDPITSKSKAGE